MKISTRWLRLGGLSLCALSAWLGQLQADTKFIRLRTELIQTAPTRPLALQQLPADEAPVTGLYLIQFTAPMETAWREALKAQAVQLLHYIPDDCFVADVRSVKLSTLRHLSFVQWVGPYEPKHKVHPQLVRDLAAHPRDRLPVKLLARPGAAGIELAAIAKALQGNVRHRTLSAGTFFEGEATPAVLTLLARSSTVLWIERAARMKLLDEVATKIVAGETDTDGSLAAVHQLGFDGRGVAVAVADSGLDSGDLSDMHPDLSGRVAALFAYDGLPDASDEHSHGTHCAGIVAGNGATREADDSGALYGLGVAPGAQIVAQRIFDGSGEYRPPPSYEAMTRDAVRSGAYVGSNSWGDEVGGQYDLSAAEFDALVRDADSLTPGEQPYVIEFSAGNSGPAPQTIMSPAVAKNVIATGATQNNRYEFPIYGEGQEVMADFSSRGPCEDGRIKPDLTAPGTWIASLRSVYANDNNAWGGISDRYMYQGGTSQAGPHVSGACAVFVQWYRDTHASAIPSPALVKAALINGADDMATAEIPDNGGLGDIFGDGEGDGGTVVVGDTGPVPNADEGWGRVNLENIISSERRFLFFDQGAGLATGKTFETRAVVGNGQKLKITLVYADVPALPAAIPALVNDLDLEVVAPDGRLFRGNAFAEGESVAGTPVGDSLNNVEAVHVAEPLAGEYLVRVRARNVVKDVHARAEGSPEQDFALVISGQLPLPGEGVISWDREAYRAPGTAEVRLLDEQLSGSATTDVRVSSSSQTTPFVLTLTRVTDRGEFRGSLVLVTNSPAPANGLFVKDGDELTVAYADAAPSGERLAKAVVDLQPPAISDVAAVGRFGRTTISWLTGEPANSALYYGTTNAVTNLVAEAGYRSQHTVSLPALETDTTYFYVVVSTDKAGNTSTNDNGGKYFRFVATRPATALLVYSPETIFAEGGLLGDTPYPGLESWSGPLDQLGIEYEVWDVQERNGAPKLDDLRAYRLVLWRPEELAAPAAGLTGALATYVQEGGALFVSSFDLLTRLKDGQQTNFVSQVLHVSSSVEDQGALSIQALPGEPVGGNLVVDLDFSAFPSGFFIDLLGIDWTLGSDALTPEPAAAPVFLQEDGRTVGLRYPRTGQDSTNGRVVFCSFPLEAVPTDGAAPNNRASLLGHALEFLVPGLQGLSSAAFERSAYTVPSAVVVEATDSRRAGQNFVDATLQVGNGVPRAFRLAETVRKGVFRGRATLVAPDAAEDTDRFRATDGDRMTVQYVDGAGRAATAVATVDTIAAVIRQVGSEPAYNEAVVSWETDKPTDALVKFSEASASFPVNRTAYTAELSTQHEVTLAGLLPDREYVFEVVSRDVPGNTTVDDNQGKRYRLRTLRPLTPPWHDNLESGRTGWAVVNTDLFSGAVIGGDDEEDGGGSFSSGAWDFGTPDPASGVRPASGTNCWATNLRHEATDLAFTDLITPAISLVGGNQATMRWKQYYDFASGGGDPEDPFGDLSIEAGQVAVSTDNGASWKDVYSITDESSLGEWEEVEVDLSKFANQVIRVRFNYQFFSFNTVARTGWLIDDLTVEMNRLTTSMVTVTNNLAQALMTLNGPTNLTVSGLVVRTNLPPGDYTITWAPVAYYVAPPPQTGALAANAALSFIGTYTFPDANTNGISDLWEAEFFGSLDPAHGTDLDSDGDGASDRQEFLVGTKPNDPKSVLDLAGPTEQPNRTTRFEWPSAPGRDYILEASHDLLHWQAVSTTLRGDGSALGVTLSPLDPRLQYYFRVRVIP